MLDKSNQTMNKVSVSLSTSRKLCTLKVCKGLTIPNMTRQTIRYDNLFNVIKTSIFQNLKLKICTIIDRINYKRGTENIENQIT